MTSKRSWASANAASATRACWRTMRTSPPALVSSAAFARIAATASAATSTRTTSAAPRESASRPTAPAPANASRKRQPGSRGARMSNSVCLTRAPVGRVARPFGALSLRPFPSPPMILAKLPDLGEAEAAFPSPLLEERLQRSRSPALHLLDVAERFGARLLEQVAIAHEVARPQAGQAPLARAEEIAGAADLEVALGDGEA